MAHDHSVKLSEDQFADCPYELIELPCDCQDVHYACGFTDYEHDLVICPG